MMKEGTTAPGGGTAPNNLYNWYAATAGTGTYAVSSGNATASICPKGWSLPTGGPSGDFAKLDIAYGGTGEKRTDITQREKLMSSVNNGPTFNWTGYRYDATVILSSANVDYWSRTNSGMCAYNLNLNGDSNSVHPQDTSNRFGGITIHCMLQE